MAAQPDGPWWSILRAGVEDLVHEIGDRETDRRDILEWLAEWGRKVRKRQSGLLLLSAHRAKGLEFDDVVVLDGAWEKRSNGEDRDAARRLYYVAMTRARRSLALTKMTDRHPILQNLNDEAFMIRRRVPGTVDVSDCRKLYKTLDPSEVFLDFAGRLHEGNASLAALESIKSDDPLLLEGREDHWVLTDRDGTSVCRLAQKFSPPAGATFLHGNAYAISTRFREDSAEQYHSHLKRDTWSVVLPELVFGPSSVADVKADKLEISTYQERILKIQKKSPNAYAAWDDDQDLELRDLFKRQIAIIEIASLMGRQPGGIRSRLKKMGLIGKNDTKQTSHDVSATLLPEDQHRVIDIEEDSDE